MADLIDAALTFPVVVFSFMLVVVMAYWFLVLLGGLGLDVLDGDAGDGSGLLAGVGLSGVPATVAISLLIAFGWFAALTGTVVIDALDLSDPVTIGLGVVALALAVVVAWAITAFAIVFVRRVLPNVKESSRTDFVGKLCTIRTAPLGNGTGQAEVTADDGSTALIHVRQTGEDEFTSGSTALIFDYDPDEEVFWVSPFAAELDPGRGA
ncbi:hypothetical protein [Phytoactinopolyspora halotolerans]|uniref:DUF1449 family protein n=1 Tax=Phytoactinopolyspora halotolerans TaxID=1981512 RepID=A0A6L9SGE9_9ACTN|nr:hypothetical protein [Phytoactinopolyspora halotolerans]NEE04223.1 hypothetical protein [Phytoactinopolyspora halotolerans]